ncbi:uncharacterized protein N7511_007143 [Penicillium nucicola]|uniref:uncharacterized protein n=1 Tax=Penicillium nucicola TaxID=1850975 RepID=UPI0025452582|nr:uncharacterized protein N7511_007143 [Penicillium nucicola]KAJ5756961.1 hypothetical protein N7511_007143 [Penicillium nucicola]
MEQIPMEKKKDDTRRFYCRFSGCTSSYWHKEHLNRHEKQHIQTETYPCYFCTRKFGRNDTLRRHIRLNHPSEEPLDRARRACRHCRDKKIRCHGGQPCQECWRRSLSCVFDDEVNVIEDNSHGDQIQTDLMPQSPKLCHISSDIQQQSIDSYFSLIHPHWPIIHRASFKIRPEEPILVYAMTALGLLTNARSEATELHEYLGHNLRKQEIKWNASMVDEMCSSHAWPMSTYQAILLHILFSLIENNRASLGQDSKQSLPSSSLGLLESLVRSCSKLGMLHYPNIPVRYEQTGSPLFAWICIEEIKRFNIALSNMCKIVGLGHYDKIFAGYRTSLPRDGKSQIQSLKIDHLWHTMARGDWVTTLNESSGDLLAS